MRFALKHAIAGAAVTAAIAAFSAASYFALLAWAVLAGEPLGGPLAFPFMVLASLIASVVSVCVVLLPVTAVTDWMCRKRRIRLPWQIPIATVLMGSWLVALLVATTVTRGTPIVASATFGGLAFLVLLLPLGLYWWTMQSADWIVGATVRWWERSSSRIWI